MKDVVDTNVKGVDFVSTKSVVDSKGTMVDELQVLKMTPLSIGQGLTDGVLKELGVSKAVSPVKNVVLFEKPVVASRSSEKFIAEVEMSGLMTDGKRVEAPGRRS